MIKYAVRSKLTGKYFTHFDLNWVHRNYNDKITHFTDSIEAAAMSDNADRAIYAAQIYVKLEDIRFYAFAGGRGEEPCNVDTSRYAEFEIIPIAIAKIPLMEMAMVVPNEESH